MEHTNNYDYTTNFSNVTKVIEDYQEHRGEVFRVVGGLITIIIALVSIIGNLAVILLYFFVETIGVEPGNVLIVYLALTDMMNGILIMIPSAITILMDAWVFGDIACHLSCALYGCFLTFSLVNIALISLDRMIAIRYPFAYRAKVTTELMVLLSTILFLHSIFLGLLCGLPNWTKFLYSEVMCGVDVTSDGLLPLVTYAIITVQAIPTCVIVTCSVLIMKTARKSRQTAQVIFVQRSQDVRNINNFAHNRKTFRTVIALVVIFHLSYSPYIIVIEMLFFWNIKVNLWINYLCTNTLFMSSAVNPFIYAIFRNDFRNGFKALIRMIREKFHSYI